MKILLLEHPRTVPPDRRNDIANTPLCSCLLSGYIAGMLRKGGHDVEIIEGYLERLSYDEVWAKVAAVKPDILGVHMVYTWERTAPFSTLSKRRRPRQLRLSRPSGSTPPSAPRIFSKVAPASMGSLPESRNWRCRGLPLQRRPKGRPSPVSSPVTGRET